MDFQFAQPYNICPAKVTLAAGTTTTLSNTGTIPFSIRGKAYSRAAMTNVATPTLDFGTGKAFIPVPALNACIFIVGLDVSGNLQACQGQLVALGPTGLFLQAPQIGAAPICFCPIGYLIIQAGSTASSAPGWTFGSSNMSGVTGITYLFGDLMGWPDRPITS